VTDSVEIVTQSAETFTIKASGSTPGDTPGGSGGGNRDRGGDVNVSIANIGV